MKDNFKQWLSQKGESLEGKGAEQLAGLYNEYNDEQRAKLAGAIEAKADKADIQRMRDELLESQMEQMKALNELLKQQGLAIEAIQRKAGSVTDGRPQPIGAQIKAALKENAERLKLLKEGSKSDSSTAGFDFEVKAVGTMTLAGNVSGGNIPVEDRLEGFNIVPSRQVRLLDLVSKRNTTSNVISWVYQAGQEGAAGQTAEGAAKNQIDFNLVVASQAVKKTTAYIKVSTEMLDDIDYIQSEIQNELLRELLKVVEVQTYSGDNTGNNHNGIRTVASAFAAGSFANAVDNANAIDVLVVAMNQIKVAQEGGAMPTAILMHPTDVTALKLTKVSSTDKRYVERLAMIAGELSLDGVPIIETTLVTAGQYLVGDFSKAISVTRQGIRIDIGLDGNDFTTNTRTILAEWRGCTIVKNNDRSAFVAGVFATDIAALETP